jgi:excisionase family DNA binding protein
VIDELLSVEDVARITGLRPPTIRAAVRDGELRATRLRRRQRISNEDLATWLDANVVQATGDIAPLPAACTPRLRTPPPSGGYRQAARERNRAA